jgi:TolB-like protein
LAEPGEVYLSRTSADQVRDKLPLRLEHRGEHAVKNISRPIEVFCVTAEEHGGTAPTARPRVQPPESSQIQGKPSVAVLAFNNMSGDSEQEYFSDGISEDIITDLSKVSGLHVIARNSSFVYKGAAVSIPQVAEELGVRYVLEGSVRKAGNRVRVTAQLIDSTNGGHIWADRFDRDLTDIFDVQDELTREIVSALELTLNAGDRDRLAHKRMVDIEAYNLFLRGREHTWLHSRQGISPHGSF